MTSMDKAMDGIMSATMRMAMLSALTAHWSFLESLVPEAIDSSVVQREITDLIENSDDEHLPALLALTGMVSQMVQYAAVVSEVGMKLSGMSEDEFGAALDNRLEEVEAAVAASEAGEAN